MKKVLIVLILFSIPDFLFPQSGWNVYQTGADSILTDICFVNENTGWAVGNSTIIKTTNGGLNWIGQNFSTTAPYTRLYCVKFKNLNTGYVVGGHFLYTIFYNDFYYSYFLKTTNGGQNWITISSNANSSMYHNNIFPINPDTLYLTSIGTAFYTTYGDILRSNNGGYNFPVNYTIDQHFYSLFFLNFNTGWVSGFYSTDYTPWNTSYIYKTTNAGVNWFTQKTDSLSSNASRIYNIMFLNGNTGYALGDRNYQGYHTKFFKTTNGGTNWTTTDYTHYKNMAMFFIDPNTGWIGGGPLPDTFSIAYTTNGGQNWTQQLKNIDIGIKDLFFINSLTGWAVPYNGNYILKTTTGGSTYIQNYSNEIPNECKLYQNYPNPFNSETKIKFKIKAKGLVELKLYDILGNELRLLINKVLDAGYYEVSLMINNFPSGIYFCKLISGKTSDTKKIMLLK